MYTFMYALLLRKLPASQRRSRQEWTWIERAKDEKDYRSWLRYEIQGKLDSRLSVKNEWKVDQLFKQWFLVTNRLRMDWMAVERKVNISEKDTVKFWHLWAYKGVADLLEAYVRHVKRMKAERAEKEEERMAKEKERAAKGVTAEEQEKEEKEENERLEKERWQEEMRWKREKVRQGMLIRSVNV